jgi:hypothetical protein
MDASEVLSAFVDGEAVDGGALAAALAEPGARETLIDFVRLRAAVTNDSRPSEAFVRGMRKRLGGGMGRRAPRLLRLAAAAVITALATFGAFDLARGFRPGPRPDEPPVATRVIRFEPGVDWKPVQGR